MSDRQKTLWHRWWNYPQQTLLRRGLFQIHMWCAIGLSLYIVFISVTGSVLVYRNELLVWAMPEPYLSQATTPLMSNVALAGSAELAHPGFSVTQINRQDPPDSATGVWLEKDGLILRRMFDPRTGEEVGKLSAIATEAVFTLMAAHDNFLAGSKGRMVNGVAAMFVLLIAMTGLILWWPGSKRWHRNLIVHRGVGWKRFNWELHNVIGFWSFSFIAIFSLSGVYLCFSEFFHSWADKVSPVTSVNSEGRFVDEVLYWLAFLHFGRVNGIGLPCDGPGFCDQSIKAIWALFGLAPAAMLVTGSIMWWNRVVKNWFRRVKK